MAQRKDLRSRGEGRHRAKLATPRRRATSPSGSRPRGSSTFRTRARGQARLSVRRMQTLPGFRDFYPTDFAARRYIFENWRRVARSYGFVEYEAPMLESVDLYRKKSGGELVGQLFDFIDKGKREVA